MSGKPSAGRSPRPHAQAAYTLVELLVAMAVLSVAFAAFAALLGVLIRHSGETQERSTLQTEARAAIDRLVQDLRQANTGDAGTPILSLGSSQITFLSPDRATPFRLRQIAYRVSGDRLERAMAVSTNTGGPPWTFPALGAWVAQAGSIVDPAVFSYVDAAGVATTNPAGVRTVNVRLRVATRTSPGAPTTYETSATLRAFS